ncbi:MAG: DUF934 domain-containing protein [Methylococcaceae bacterium]|nr:DUF934 domain-containing protein [Methylococcaceae bacterium]
MQIIKDGNIVADHWRHLDDDQAPAGDQFTVSFARWLAEKAALLATGAAVGVRLNGDDPLDAIANDLPSLNLIVVEFPSLTDGRGFSIVRLLRDRYGFDGEIRARGDFIRDQVYFLGRVGVNAFECRHECDLESLLSALTDFTVYYQTASGDRQPPARKRG